MTLAALVVGMLAATGTLSVLDLMLAPHGPSDVEGASPRPSATLTVGAGGFPTVSEAIRAARPYDIVRVGEGVFSEPIVIDKPITLQGMGPQTVYTNMLTVSADDVTIDGDTFSGIRGSNWDTAGIITRKYNSASVYRLAVKNCIFTDCRQGVFLFGAVSCMIDACKFDNCTRGVTIRGHNTGYYSYAAYDNTVKDCKFYDQKASGLNDGEAIAINGTYDFRTYNNYILDNVMEGNVYGVHIDSSTGNEVKGCTITRSTHEPLSFLNIDGGLTVTGNTLSENAGYVSIKDSYGFSFSSNTVRNNTGDIFLLRCTSFVFNSNTINGSTVILMFSEGGSFSGNTFEMSQKTSFAFWVSGTADYDHAIATDNTVGGLPIYYIYNGHQTSLADKTAGAIMLVGCLDPRVTNCTVLDGDGVAVWYCVNATVSATVSNCLLGISILGSNGFTLENCTVSASDRGEQPLMIGSTGRVLDTVLSSGNSQNDWRIVNGATVDCYNTTFNLSRVDANGQLRVHNYLGVKVWDNGSVDPLPDVQVQVLEGDAPLYATSHFGGTDAPTDADGEVARICLLDRVYYFNIKVTEHSYNLTVWASIDAVWTETRKDLNMSAPRTEAFEAADIRAPGTPTNLIAVDRPLLDAIDISWDANTDDTQVYSVYCDATGEWRLLMNVTAPNASCRMESGLVHNTTYRFKVSAWDEVPLQSPLSTLAGVFHTDGLPPGAPTGLRALSINGTNCTLGWDASPEADLAGYRLYVNATGAGPSGPWTALTPAAGTLETRSWVQGLTSETDYFFRLTAFDEVPLESPGSLVLKVRTLDITAPLAPVLDALSAYTNEPGPDVTGHAEANSTVTVFVNGREAGTGKADMDGAFSIAVTLADGANTVAAWATDNSSNTGPLSPAAETILDMRAPEAPELDELPALTNVPVHTVKGVAEAFSTVTVLNNGEATGTVTTGEDGAFELEVTFTEGNNLISAFATDRAKNAGPRAAAIKVVLDTIAPLAPVLQAPVEYVNDPELTLRGTAEALSKVELLVGGAVVATTSADLNGDFSVTITLTVRRTDLSARATDAATNVGPSSATATVILDTELPVARAGADINDVEEREVVLDASASTDNEGIADYTWTFNLGGTDVKLSGAKANYTFPDPVTLTVTLVVRDLAGNTATDTLDVVIVRKNLPPTLTDDTMTPEKGTTKTDFTFTVTFTDIDRDNGTVYVVIDGQRFGMTADPADTDSTDGRDYTYTTRLGLGPHTYYFEGQDDKDNPAGGESAGPSAQKTTPEVTKPKTVSSNGMGILAIVIVLIVIAAIVAIALSRRGKR